jgi:hypothetical protein
MYVSTLRRFVEAMGGELEISARFPDGTVRITHFQELDSGRKQVRRYSDSGVPSSAVSSSRRRTSSAAVLASRTRRR